MYLLRLLVWGIIYLAVPLVSGQRASKTPVMGWSGYQALMQFSGQCDKAGALGYNETTFVETMDVLVSSGLKELGYVYLNSDDCWSADTRNPKTGRLQPNSTRFPHGMAWLADEAHKRGLKLGLYAAASNHTCRGYPGSAGHEYLDAQTLIGWGADFIKLDDCGYDPGYNKAQLEIVAYTKWSKAITKYSSTNTSVVFSCSWPAYYDFCAQKVPPSQRKEKCGASPWDDNYITGICNMWRYWKDGEPTWASISGIMEWTRDGPFAGALTAASMTYGSNDPDFLAVGCPTDGPCEKGGPKLTPLSDVEQRTQFTMWSMFAAPLIIGSDIRHLSKYALETLSNKDVIAINQDPAAHFPICVFENSKLGEQIWSRQLEKEREKAVVLLNMGDVPLTFSLTFALIGFPADAPVQVVDLWAKTSKKITYGFNQLVQPHEAKIYMVSY